MGSVRRARNLLYRSGVLTKRHQMTYDNVASVRGLGTWHDTSTGTRRLISLDSSDVVRVKGSASETWSASVGTLAGDGVILDSASYRGRWFGITGSTTRVPTTFGVYNGTATATAILDGSTGEDGFKPYTVCPYIDRLFFGGARLSIYNFLYDNPTDYVYSASAWTRTNITATSVTSSGVTLSRITPTDTTTASMTALALAAVGGTTLIWRADLRGVHQSYRVPMTMKWKYQTQWTVATDYSQGEVVVPTSGGAVGYRFRCTVAGTSHAATEPTWTTTVGATYTDNTVTWINDGPDVAAQLKIFVPSASESVTFTPFSLAVRVPEGTAGGGIGPVLEFGHDGVAFTLAPVDFSLKDGRTNGDPRKQNYGQQITSGSFHYPFYNVETTTSATVDHSYYLYYSPPGEPERVNATGSYRLSSPGPITAVREWDGRLAVFQRTTLTLFNSVSDANIVVLPEGTPRTGYGCLNAQACDIGPDGELYFIGENEVYRLARGSDTPEPLCGDAMRDEIMNKASASWVESQAFPANAALLTVDPKNREVWVYTQKGNPYVYNIDRSAWTGPMDVSGSTSVTPVGYQISAMKYNANTGNVYFAYSTAPGVTTPSLARMDTTQSASRDNISQGSPVDVAADLWLRPIEPRGGPRKINVELVRLFHRVTGSQTGNTTTAYMSYNHGATFPNSNQVTLDPVSEGNYKPMTIALRKTRETIMLRLLHLGFGGSASFNVSAVEADVQNVGPSNTYDNPTPGTYT
jgi:hypothetical protein